MARIRTIKPGIWLSPQVMNLSHVARLLFLGLITQADDHGRGIADARKLKASIFPGDDITSADVLKMLDELQGQSLAVLYEAEGHGRLFELPSWERHQRIDKPGRSTYPAPDQSVTGVSRNVPGTIKESSKNVPAGREGKGTERKGTEGILPGLAPSHAEDSTEQTQADARPTAHDVVAIWNEVVTSPIPKVTRLTSDRETKINARLQSYPDLRMWRTVIVWINGQDWCRKPGRGEHPNWCATLDWLTKSDGNFVRQLERAEADRTAAPRRPEVQVAASYIDDSAKYADCRFPQ